MIDQKTRYPNLLAEIARRGCNKQAIAALLGLSAPSLSRRLDGSIEWSKSEIDSLCEYFNKPYDYLFAVDAV